MGAGVTRAVSSLQAGQWGVAARALRADVAVASTAKASPMQVHGDDGAWAWAIACMGVLVFLGFGLDNAVNSVSPNIRGVRAKHYLMRFSTFGNLVVAIGDWSH